MIWIYRLLIVLVSGTIFNVWLLRLGNPTPYRGGDAASLQEEFLTYGLGDSLFYFVGGLKLLAAILLVVGLKFEKLIVPASQIIAVLMIGAIAMHFKVADPWLKSLPAATMLLMSFAIMRLHKQL
ncbi:MAG: DoxX family protein [Flavobacteriaceae bacterium]